MCHNSSLEQSTQIERFVEQGMPQKIVKTVQYTLKKRAKEREVSNTKIDEIQDMPATDLNGNSTSLTTAMTTVTTTTTAAKLADLHFPSTQNHAANNPEVESNHNQIKIPKLCGRFRKLQQQQQHKDNNNDNNKVYTDVLAVGTQLTRQFVDHLNRIAENVQNSKIYTVLTTTTQPAHIVAICILSFVLLTVWPELIDSNNSSATTTTTTTTRIKTETHHNNNDYDSKRSSNNKNTLAIIAYLGAFATHFGSQIWMTFVSGLSLYFSLPRHTFGQCQQILFPKYFALNAMLSIMMLILFVKYLMSSWTLASCVQFSALVLSAFIEVAVRLYLAPPMLRLMMEKYKIEDAIGSGQEVGTIVQGDLVQCPHYQRIHKSFRRIHMTVAMGNMTVLMATFVQLYFLALKIQIS